MAESLLGYVNSHYVNFFEVNGSLLFDFVPVDTIPASGEVICANLENRNFMTPGEKRAYVAAQEIRAFTAAHETRVFIVPGKRTEPCH